MRKIIYAFLLISIFIPNVYARGGDFGGSHSSGFSVDTIFSLVIGIIASLPIYAFLMHFNKYLPNNYCSGSRANRRKAWLAIPFICGLSLSQIVLSPSEYYVYFIITGTLIVIAIFLLLIDWVSSQIEFDILSALLSVCIFFAIFYAIYKFSS